MDLRDVYPTGLTISGPTVCRTGSSIELEAFLQFAGSQNQVTGEVKWSATGSVLSEPAMHRAVLDGNVLRVSPYAMWGEKVQIKASYRYPNGQITSAPHEVTIGDTDTLGIGLNNPRKTYLRAEGAAVVWRIEASVHGQAVNAPGVVWDWRLNGQPLDVQSGTFTYDVEGLPGAHTLKVTATDSLGRTGTDEFSFALSRPDPNEPGQSFDTTPPAGASLKDSDGDVFQFDAAKTPNGLVVLVHGLTDRPDAEWIRTMSLAIQTRMADENKPPNVVIFGWEDAADPANYYREIGDPTFIERLLKLSVATQSLVMFGSDFLFNIEAVKPHALDYGVGLKEWVAKEIELGNIDAAKPIHLIGHSAGGFVVGEAAWQLRGLVSNCQVTMLDTPAPETRHVFTLPNPTRVECYISSAYGAAGTMAWIPPLNEDYFRRKNLHSQIVLQYAFDFDFHREAYEWYADTVRENQNADDGFAYSPLLMDQWGNASVPVAASFAAKAATMHASDFTAPSATEPVAGFDTFGNVSPNGTGYALTEGTNAGVKKMMTLPVGAESLRFHYQFTSPGDGDYLVVYFGDSFPLFIASDGETARSAGLDANVPLQGYEGQTGQLVIKLVSQGQVNATMAIHDIEIVTTDDPDHDGLTIMQEDALGTNPLAFDSDSDMLSDSAEINTYFTNPMLADSDGDGTNDNAELTAGTSPTNGQSFFRVTDAVKNTNGTMLLRWPSQAGRFYNVQRSTDVTFATYEVIGQGQTATPPLNTHVDNSAGASPDGRYFYRIEVYQP